MNRLTQFLVVLAVMSVLTMPAFAEGVLGEASGGLDTLLMAALLFVFGFFLQKFTKK